jgi:hypothetical protein
MPTKKKSKTHKPKRPKKVPDTTASDILRAIVGSIKTFNAAGNAAFLTIEQLNQARLFLGLDEIHKEKEVCSGCACPYVDCQCWYSRR